MNSASKSSRIRPPTRNNLASPIRSLTKKSSLLDAALEYRGLGSLIPSLGGTSHYAVNAATGAALAEALGRNASIPTKILHPKKLRASGILAGLAAGGLEGGLGALASPLVSRGYSGSQVAKALAGGALAGELLEAGALNAGSGISAVGSGISKSTKAVGNTASELGNAIASKFDLKKGLMGSHTGATVGGALASELARTGVETLRGGKGKVLGRLGDEAHGILEKFIMGKGTISSKQLESLANRYEAAGVRVPKLPASAFDSKGNLVDPGAVGEYLSALSSAATRNTANTALLSMGSGLLSGLGVGGLEGTLGAAGAGLSALDTKASFMDRLKRIGAAGLIGSGAETINDGSAVTKLVNNLTGMPSLAEITPGLVGGASIYQGANYLTPAVASAFNKKMRGLPGGSLPGLMGAGAALSGSPWLGGSLLTVAPFYNKNVSKFVNEVSELTKEKRKVEKLLPPTTKSSSYGRNALSAPVKVRSRRRTKVAFKWLGKVLRTAEGKANLYRDALSHTTLTGAGRTAPATAPSWWRNPLQRMRYGAVEAEALRHGRTADQAAQIASNSGRGLSASGTTPAALHTPTTPATVPNRPDFTNVDRANLPSTSAAGQGLEPLPQGATAVHTWTPRAVDSAGNAIGQHIGPIDRMSVGRVGLGAVGTGALATAAATTAGIASLPFMGVLAPVVAGGVLASRKLLGRYAAAAPEAMRLLESRGVAEGVSDLFHGAEAIKGSQLAKIMRESGFTQGFSEQIGHDITGAMGNIRSLNITAPEHMREIHTAAREAIESGNLANLETMLINRGFARAAAAPIARELTPGLERTLADVNTRYQNMNNALSRELAKRNQQASNSLDTLLSHRSIIPGGKDMLVSRAESLGVNPQELSSVGENVQGVVQALGASSPEARSLIRAFEEATGANGSPQTLAEFNAQLRSYLSTGSGNFTAGGRSVQLTSSPEKLTRLQEQFDYTVNTNAPGELLNIANLQGNTAQSMRLQRALGVEATRSLGTLAAGTPEQRALAEQVLSGAKTGNNMSISELDNFARAGGIGIVPGTGPFARATPLSATEELTNLSTIFRGHAAAAAAGTAGAAASPSGFSVTYANANRLLEQSMQPGHSLEAMHAAQQEMVNTLRTQLTRHSGRSAAATNIQTQLTAAEAELRNIAETRQLAEQQLRPMRDAVNTHTDIVATARTDAYRNASSYTNISRNAEGLGSIQEQLNPEEMSQFLRYAQSAPREEVIATMMEHRGLTPQQAESFLVRNRLLPERPAIPVGGGGANPAGGPGALGYAGGAAALGGAGYYGSRPDTAGYAYPGGTTAHVGRSALSAPVIGRNKFAQARVISPLQAPVAARLR